MEKVEGTPDSFIVKNFLDNSLADRVVDLLEREVEWPKYGSHGAPKAVFQAKERDDSFAYLRCPSIKPSEITSFSPTVSVISEAVNEGKCNIAKILKYEGSSKLKNHADKIIDLQERSNIYTLRFGETRNLLLKEKQGNKEILIEMPHNTLFILGWETNRFFTHGAPKINLEKQTYSIVLRTSVTWLHKPTLRLWGPRTEFSTTESLLLSKIPTYDEIKTAETQLTRLWAIENKTTVDLNHYSLF